MRLRMGIIEFWQTDPADSIPCIIIGEIESGDTKRRKGIAIITTLMVKILIAAFETIKWPTSLAISLL